jgi:hypothetical protein
MTTCRLKGNAAMSVSARTFTPDREEITEDGRTVTHLHLKRCCNGCGHTIGDVESRDVDDKGNLTDVRGECPNCAPLVALEAAGCKTWHLLPRDLTEIAHQIGQLGVPVKGDYQGGPDGFPDFIGLRIGEKPNHVVARFGDWIVRHPDGRWSVHAGPKATVETAREA